MNASIRVIRALYQAAANILNPQIPFNAGIPAICTIGNVAQLLPTYRQQGGVMPPVIAEGVPSRDVDLIFCNTSASRKTAAKSLRDLADKLVIARRKGSKMNVAALLNAARYIEDNPNEYMQGRPSNCMIGIAARLIGRRLRDSQEALGLTAKQFRKLFYFKAIYVSTGKPFRHSDAQYQGMVGYDAFDSLPAETRAKIAAARLRRMALYGT